MCRNADSKSTAPFAVTSGNWLLTIQAAWPSQHLVEVPCHSQLASHLEKRTWLIHPHVQWNNHHLFDENGTTGENAEKYEYLLKWGMDKIWYIAKGWERTSTSRVCPYRCGFAVADLVQTFSTASFPGGPLSVLQWWQPHDPLNTTLVIPNFVPFSNVSSLRKGWLGIVGGVQYLSTSFNSGLGKANAKNPHINTTIPPGQFVVFVQPNGSDMFWQLRQTPHQRSKTSSCATCHLQTSPALGGLLREFVTNGNEIGSQFNRVFCAWKKKEKIFSVSVSKWWHRSCFIAIQKKHENIPTSLFHWENSDQSGFFQQLPWPLDQTTLLQSIS